MTAHILRGDARHLPLADQSVDAICTDPPYELSFMGAKWDSTGVAYDTATWREALRVLKPGGHMLAFGGTRTWHRLACAIEDAGFEIRDTIMWLYGSGFPKSRDVSKDIDKAAGAEREIIGRRPDADKLSFGGKDPGWDRPWMHDVEALERCRSLTAPATADARRWHGWGTALKPGFEPIVVARKPLARTVASNVLAYGTGALNIDGCRLATSVPIAAPHGTRHPRTAMGNGWHDAYESGDAGKVMQTAGRWPTNVVLSHQPLLDDDSRIVGDACADGCIPGCPAADLDQQSGTLTSGANPTRRNSDKFRNAYGDFTGQAECTPARGPDSGGASRFFPTFRYQAKADNWERPVINGHAHPTVKPLDLIRWLCRLITPPGGLILDQFAGSGTTLEAALMEGFHVIGGNDTGEYVQHIRYRIDRARRRLQPGIARLGRAKPATQINGQDGLFDLTGGGL